MNRDLKLNVEQFWSQYDKICQKHLPNKEKMEQFNMEVFDNSKIYVSYCYHKRPKFYRIQLTFDNNLKNYHN
ncbi:ATV_HP_G0095430.mRNA.1.CDS.1 [Saccharomyces cerevisiae]|nr:ATV_HP_G0095430.mRNA.1.CDS.1 [Saccharomyces cerevisiae]CAI6533969.1 ATV_HP_G0095430.mRNA.1.CDS.1 [Saccharomyces cerevisiae]